MDETPGNEACEAQPARWCRLRTLCRWLTCRPAVAVYALCIGYADKRIFFVDLLDFAPIAVLLSAVFWYVTLRVAIRSFLFTLLVVLPLFMDMVVELYAVMVYHVEYRTVIETAFHTNLRQASPFLDVWTVLCMVAGVLAVAAVPVAGRLARRSGVWRPLLVWGVVVACIAASVKGPAKYHLSLYKKYNWNWNTWLGETAQQEGLVDNHQFREYVDIWRPEDVFIPSSRLLTWWDEAEKCYFPRAYEDSAEAHSECHLPAGRVNVALYIVESFRRDHSSLHGYARNTLPMLAGCRGNIIVLPNMRSFGTHSVQSLFGMLGDADETNREGGHTSFMALFRKHGFNCMLLENNAFGASWSDRPLFRQLLKGCCSSEMIVHGDNDFPPHTAKHLAQNERNMFVIYDGTSHYPFDEGAGGRYGDTLIDRYDETRHTIDAAAARFLDSLADTPSIVLITSDHGESFGEGGRLCHGGPLTADEQREVFSIIWYSDAYAEKFPEIVRALRENAAAFTSQDFFYHTIPSMGGIHSSLCKPEWDMTEEHPVAPSSQPVQEELGK